MLEGIDFRDVDVDEADLGILERGLGCRGEIAQARADGDDQVGLARRDVRARSAGDADRAEILRVIEGQRALACLGLSHGNAGLLREPGQCLGCFAVEYAAARHNQRPAGRADPLGGDRQLTALGFGAGDVPDALLEHLFGIVERLGLYILRQRQGDGAGLGGRGQDAHGFGQRADQLIGPVDAVPVARNRLESVVDRDVLGVLILNLLQHRRYVAAREDVAGQQQHRDAVDRGGGRAGDHVGGAGSDRRGADERGLAVPRLGESRGNVDGALLVAAEIVGEVGVLLQRLPQAGDDAVSEDAPGTVEKAVFHAVVLYVLFLEKAHQCLGHRNVTSTHRLLLTFPCPW